LTHCCVFRLIFYSIIAASRQEATVHEVTTVLPGLDWTAFTDHWTAPDLSCPSVYFLVRFSFKFSV